MMFPWWMKAYFSLVQIPVKVFVRSKPIPTDPIDELRLDVNRPILYLLSYDSHIDLMVVRSLCKKYQFPDPLKAIKINGKRYPAFMYANNERPIFSSKNKKMKSAEILEKYLSLYQSHKNTDMQILPVSVMFGRRPDNEQGKTASRSLLSCVCKFFKMIISGRDCYTRFSQPVMFVDMKLEKNFNASRMTTKLLRVARIHFTKQKMAAIGPKLPVRQEMLNELLAKSALSEAILDESKSRDISIEKAQENALALLDEIAANFSYRMLRITDLVLTWAWNRLYQGLKVTNAEPVRELAQNDYEIIYVPCHRSHMDYLLLSYVLYREGLVPPHIAAGINLNFWPAGTIFRHLGAFFIRRSFRGSKLYTAVFREYLAELFARGYSVEYFVEGGRSRTGRLLDPKTGMLMMTIQALLRGEKRPISVVPVYIGYEHVLEVATYANELRGATKQKENLWQTLKAFFKLKKLGYGYVNFGEPIVLNQFLNDHIPEWQNDIDPAGMARPSWLTPTSNLLGTQIMERINASAAVNPMNLCCSILLSADQHALTKKRLLAYITYTLHFLKRIPYSNLMTLPDTSPEEVLEHAMQMGKFEVVNDGVGEIISLSKEQAILMTYYRNNIQHLFIVPTIIARILLKNKRMAPEKLIEQMQLLYPLIKAELFLRYDESQLTEYIQQIITVFVELDLISVSPEEISINYLKTTDILLFASSSKDILQRHFIVFSLLNKKPSMSRSSIEKEGRFIAERLSVLNGINSPEFFDKAVFTTLVASLREQGYLDYQEGNNLEKIKEMNDILHPLISRKVIHTIEEITLS